MREFIRPGSSEATWVIVARDGTVAETIRLPVYIRPLYIGPRDIVLHVGREEGEEVVVRRLNR